MYLFVNITAMFLSLWTTVVPMLAPTLYHPTGVGKYSGHWPSDPPVREEHTYVRELERTLLCYFICSTNIYWAPTLYQAQF